MQAKIIADFLLEFEADEYVKEIPYNIEDIMKNSVVVEINDGNEYKYYNKTLEVHTVPCVFKKIYEITRHISEFPPEKLPDDQRDILKQYLMASRLEDVNSYKTNDNKSQKLILTMTGIVLSDEKRFNIDIKQVINKNSSSEELVKAISRAFNEYDKVDSNSKRNQIIGELITRCCIEKKFLLLYFEVLKHILQSGLFGTTTGYIVSLLERTFDDVVIKKDFTNNQFLQSNLELWDLFSEELCNLIGIFVTTQEEFYVLGSSCALKLSHDASLLKYAINIVKYLGPHDIARFKGKYEEYKSRNEVSELVQFKYEEMEEHIEQRRAMGESIRAPNSNKSSDTGELKEAHQVAIQNCIDNMSCDDMAHIEKRLKELSLLDIVLELLNFGGEEGRAILCQEFITLVGLITEQYLITDQIGELKYMLLQLCREMKLPQPESWHVLSEIVEYYINRVSGVAGKRPICKLIAELLFCNKIHPRMNIIGLLATDHIRDIFVGIIIQSVKSTCSDLHDSAYQFSAPFLNIMRYIIEFEHVDLIYQLEKLREVREIMVETYGCKSRALLNVFQQDIIYNVQSIAKNDPTFFHLLEESFSSEEETAEDFYIRLFQALGHQYLIQAIPGISYEKVSKMDVEAYQLYEYRLDWIISKRLGAEQFANLVLEMKTPVIASKILVAGFRREKYNQSEAHNFITELKEENLRGLAKQLSALAAEVNKYFK